MNKLLIICASIIVGCLFLFKYAKYYVINSRRKEFKDWRIGDVITLTDGSNIKVVAWSVNGIYFKNNEGIAAKIDWANFKNNLSAIWRRNFDECLRDMNVRPFFSPEIKEIRETNPDIILVYGKPIDTLTETECQIYLKMAIEEENYELAELLKRKLRK